jgi:transposase
VLLHGEPENTLFAGSDGGTEHKAVFASLIETCKLVGIEPQAYLADVITQIVDNHPDSRLHDVLPCSCPAAQDLRAVAREHRLPEALLTVVVECEWHSRE